MLGSRNLCAQTPIDLHHRVCEAREQSGLTTAQYITNLLIEYYEMKENRGKTAMANNTRTMAFQIPEELFQRIKAHLERETRRTGRKVTQREFVLGLIEEALETAEREVDTASSEPEKPPQQETDVGSCEIREDGFRHEGVGEAADPDGAENSNLPSDAPADDSVIEDVPGSGASEGETASSDGDMDYEGDPGVDEGLVASSGGETDGGPTSFDVTVMGLTEGVSGGLRTRLRHFKVMSMGQLRYSH